MIRFDGNSMLVVDGDKSYCAQLCEVLRQMGAQCFYAIDIAGAKKLFDKYEFDVVISNYHLSDGIIYQLIDWCTNKLTMLPVFTCLEYPLPRDLKLTHKFSIADVFSKSDSSKMFSRLSHLLFDFNQFHADMLELISPTEIIIKASVGDSTTDVRPIEISEEILFLHSDHDFPKSAYGMLKFSMCFENQTHNFVIPGYFEGENEGIIHFSITKSYLKNWHEFLHYLNKRQLTITHFMKKASGY